MRHLQEKKKLFSSRAIGYAKSMYTILHENGLGPLGRRGIALTSEIMNRHYRRDEDFVC